MVERPRIANEHEMRRMNAARDAAERQGERCFTCGRVIGTSQVNPVMLRGWPAAPGEPEPRALCRSCAREPASDG